MKEKVMPRPLSLLALCAVLALASPSAGQEPVVHTVAGRPPGDGWPATKAQLNFGNYLHVNRATGFLYFSENHGTGVRRIVPGAGAVDGEADEIISTVAPGQFTLGVVSNAPGDTLWYAAGNRVFRLMGGVQDRFAGGGRNAPSLTPVPATSVRLAFVRGLAYDDARGILYLADAATHRVLKVQGGQISIAAGASGLPGLAGDGGPATDAAVRLNEPRGLTLDTAGNLYVAEGENNRVRRIDTAGVITTFTAMPEGQPPDTLDWDPRTGSLVVGSYYGDRVYRVDGTGTRVTVLAGTGLSEQPPGSSPDGIPAVERALRPDGVAVDAAGDVYIYQPFQITKVYAATGLSRRVAGVPYGHGVTAGVGMLTSAYDLVVDRHGTLLTNDSYLRRVRCVDARSGRVEICIGAGHGYADGHTRTQARFDQPNGVALGREGTLYIGEGRNATLRKAYPGRDGRFDGSADERVITVAGVPFPVTGDPEGSPEPVPDGTPALSARLSGQNGFFRPLVEDGQGSLFFADIVHNAVYRITPGPDGEVNGGPGEVVTRVAGTVESTPEGPRGAYGCGPESVPARQSPLAFPFSLTFDREGNLYIADNDCGRIRKVAHGGNHRIDGGDVDPRELVTTVAGPAGPGNPGEGDFAWGEFADGPALSARFFFPGGIRFDPTGNLYVADIANHRVRRVSAGPRGSLDGAGLVTTVAGTGVPTLGVDGPGGDPSDDFRDDRAATDTSLSYPHALAIDADGNIVFSDAGNYVLRQLSLPGASLAVDAGGRGIVTREELTAPLACERFDPGSITLQPLDAFGLPLADWSRRTGRLSQCEDADGDGVAELVATFHDDALGPDPHGIHARQRAQLRDGRWTVITVELP